MKPNPLQHIIEYNLDIGKTKPDTVHRDESYCPFCDVPHLKNIMDVKGHMIWLENAYPVLKDAWQTLIIETDDCDGDFSTYDNTYAVELIRFGLKKWQYVKALDRFRNGSVVFYRNHGYMSGGTIHHPHSQIVGFEQYDYHDDIKPYHFEGTPILCPKGMEINVSLRPIIGFYEVNLMLRDASQLPEFVYYMQKTADYFASHFIRHNDSYNIFFYDFPNDSSLYVKIMPRFLTNPLFVGYMIPQISNAEHRNHFIEALKTHLTH